MPIELNPCVCGGTQLHRNGASDGEGLLVAHITCQVCKRRATGQAVDQPNAEALAAARWNQLMPAEPASSYTKGLQS
jgi:hypothetical protein